MNAPAIPRPRGNWSAKADEQIRAAYKELLRGHKKQAKRAVESLRRRVDKLYLEVMDDDAKRAFFGPKVKLIEKHPSWSTGITLPNRVDRVVRF